MTAKWRVVVERAVCIGSGICAATASHRFALGADRHALPVQELVDPDAAVLDAARACPVEAIVIVEAGSGRAVFPEE